MAWRHGRDDEGLARARKRHAISERLRMKLEMTPQRWERIEQLFHSAAERTAEERAAYLEVACAGDAELRREVESLLAHDGAKGLLESHSRGRTLVGQQIGSYQVVSLLGAGGMGEVYLARDGKLGRDVAVKVLPESFAHDPERLARFQREARILASLNHPNIATIHGLEQSDGTNCLVMELVAGETLADRVSREGALPGEEALKIALQVAEALEAAHDKGIIHRDLKPANIKVRPEGKVKVLDFGLAKALAGDADGHPSRLPALSAADTIQGAILGTPVYMSPEQACGKAVDQRADIWAFGCVLYEMLTGKPAFEGETVTEILASVLKGTPDWQALPPGTPAQVRLLLRRCLERDLRHRLQHIGEARIAIETVFSGVDAREAIVRKSILGDARFAWALSLAVLGAALAVGAFAHFGREREVTVRFSVPSPPGWTFEQSPSDGISPAPLAISPDGRQLVFAAVNADGKSVLWIRPLDTLVAQAMPGTEGATQPFWSPDSRFLAFFANGKLKKIDVSGGPPITLCSAPLGVSGGWGREGVIIFALSPPGSAIQKVSASGGEPTAALTLGQGEFSESRPVFLPDGRHFLYRTSIRAEGIPIYVASLDSSERKFLFDADASPILYSEGHLLFLRERTLMAQPFDLHKLEFTGDAFPLAEQIQISQTANPNAFFSVSDNGVLAYQTGADAVGSRLVWLDRGGRQIETLGEPAVYRDLDLSPDGKQVVVEIQGAGKRELWLYDAQHPTRVRFTFSPVFTSNPLWSPDGSRVLYNSNPKGHLDLYQKASDGAGNEELLYEDNLDKFPDSWSPDGRFIMYAGINSNHAGLFVLPLTGDRKPFPFLKTQFSESVGQFSPDGRWVAYSSNESGRNEIYVAPFPGPGGKWQISTAGGNWPRWRHDGSEIFYLSPDNKLMSTRVNGKGASLEVGDAKPLFETRAAVGGYQYSYAVSADGQRFLVNTEVAPALSAPITVVLNWTGGFKH